MIADSAFDVGQYWLDEVLAALMACDRPDISTAYVGVGQVPADDCCGMLVVTPELIYRSQTFPASFDEAEFCNNGLITLQMLITLGRCIPVLDDRGRFPSSQSLNDAHKSMMEDAAVIWSRVSGVLPDGWERAGLSQSFIGPEGGCVICETRFTIGLEQSLFTCCQEPSDDD